MKTLEQAARAFMSAWDAVDSTLDSSVSVDPHELHAALNKAEIDLRDALAAESGRVSVPREPTPALRRAIIEANGWHDEMYPHDGILRADRIWQAMLAAAQERPQDDDYWADQRYDAYARDPHLAAAQEGPKNES